MGLAGGMNLKFYTSVTKGLNKKIRKFRGLVPTFLKVIGEKLAAGGGGEGEAFGPAILNRVKTGITFSNLLLFIKIRVCKFAKVILNPCCEGLFEDHFVSK